MRGCLMPWQMPREKYYPIMLCIVRITIMRLRPDDSLIEPGIILYSCSCDYSFQSTPSFVIIPETSSGGIISNAG